MKKILLITTIVGLTILTGCQQLQSQADNIKQQGQQAIDNLSQQADNIKTEVLQTKAKYDEKSQQVVNTVNDFNQLTH